MIQFAFVVLAFGAIGWAFYTAWVFCQFDAMREKVEEKRGEDE